MKRLLSLIPCLLGLGLSAEVPRPRLQIINGGSMPADIFWLKSDTERVPNGSAAPG